MLRTSNKQLISEPFQYVEILVGFLKYKIFLYFFTEIFYIYFLAGYPVIQPANKNFDKFDE